MVGAAKRKKVAKVGTQQRDSLKLRRDSKTLEAHAEVVRNALQLLQIRHSALDHRQDLLKQRETRARRDDLNLTSNRFRLIVESLPVAIGQLDCDQRLRFCNKVFATLFKIPQIALYGKCIWEILGENAYEIMRPYIVKAIRGDEQTCELSLGEKGPHFYCKFVPDRRGDGAVISAFIILLDISERKITEQRLRKSESSYRHLAKERAQLMDIQRNLLADARQASRTKDLFLAMVSHEIRTPLTSILGWSSIIRSRKLQPGQLESAMESIERNARQQIQVVDDLLDVSRITQGKLRLDLEDVDVHAVVRSVIDAIQPALAPKKLQLSLESMGNRIPIIRADPRRFGQILNNLLTNAIKFSGQDGRIQIAVKQANSHVLISVTDNGKGIAPEFLPHVFDLFEQEDMSSNRSAGGLGLGLSIVRRLVELHGGTIRASSPGLGLGATFEFRIPVQAPKVPLGKPNCSA